MSIKLLALMSVAQTKGHLQAIRDFEDIMGEQGPIVAALVISIVDSDASECLRSRS
jgi:hypothetical protein